MKLADRELETAIPREGWILCDGRCGFCFRWVRFWKKIVEARGFAIKDLQSASAEGLLQVPREHLLDDIRVLNSRGQLQSGADAYLYLAQRIWWAWPFCAIFRLPACMLWWGYRWFNRNRHRISRHCPLPREAGAGRFRKIASERFPSIPFLFGSRGLTMLSCES
jgi:predicted DCC family thiol-disulfide oxidoreductase YuxK